MLFYLSKLVSDNATPLLKDLYEDITPQYATDWKVIGTMLGVPKEELKIIEYDNHHKAVLCCNAMWDKWLEVDDTATWNKLRQVIDSRALSTKQGVNKGDYSYNCMYVLYVLCAAVNKRIC